jgi:hypothetical protein
MSGRCCPVCHCCPSTDLLSLLQGYCNAMYMPLPPPQPPPLSSYCSYFAVVPLPPSTNCQIRYSRPGISSFLLAWARIAHSFHPFLPQSPSPFHRPVRNHIIPASTRANCGLRGATVVRGWAVILEMAHLRGPPCLPSWIAMLAARGPRERIPPGRLRYGPALNSRSAR